jgi:hypothetical protein
MTAIPLLVFCCVLVLWIGSGFWAYGDAVKRGKPPLAVVILVVLGAWPLGWCAWIAFRPEINTRRPKPFNLQDYRRQ